MADRAINTRGATWTASIGGSRQVMGPVGLSIGMTLILVLTSSTTETRLGAPLYWSWLLTSLQVLALWAAGAGYRWGWMLGASVQPSWIAYAVLTDQGGFVPGCVISAAVQLGSFLRGQGPRVGGRYSWPLETTPLPRREHIRHTAADEAGGDGSDRNPSGDPLS